MQAKSGDPPRRGPEGKLELTCTPERIAEGFRPAQFGRVTPRGGELKQLRGISGRDDYDISVKSQRLNRRLVWRRRAGSNRCIAVLQN